MEQTVVIRLHHEQLSNPNLDLRYAIPDVIEEQSGGLVRGAGYDDSEHGEDALLLTLTTTDLKRGLDCVLEVIENVRVLGNDLRQAVVAVVTAEGDRVIYPANHRGGFLR
jgi:hypothetical protein